MLYSHRINEVQPMGILMNAFGVSYAQFFPARVVVGYVKALVNNDGNMACYYLSMGFNRSF